MVGGGGGKLEKYKLIKSPDSIKNIQNSGHVQRHLKAT